MPNFSQYRGIGSTSQKVRSRLIDSLEQKGLKSAKVRSIMKDVPRHFFIDEAMASHAYENASLPIGYSQTISQPQVVALMSQSIAEGKCQRVLEIGTGCGYQTAILAQMFDKVWTVERIEGLYQKAQEKLSTLKFDNIEFYFGDGFNTPYQDSFFDAIVLTAAPEEVPQSLLKKLAIGGRLVAPIGNEHQILTRFTYDGESYQKQDLGEVSFVPLLGGTSV
jgi:protein-L-isoaspartate(D-aspartate) O-methyltransferase